MGRNRFVGAPYQPTVITESTTTQFTFDLYLVEATLGIPVTVTLDPYAVQGDQVAIQDIANNASAQGILILASEGQTILNGFGESISITTDGGGVQLTFDQALSAWVPAALIASAGSGSVDSVSGAAPITSTGGANPIIGITPATEAAAGSMSAADKTKLDGITPGAAVAQVTGTAPIVITGTLTDPNVTITAATDGAAGSMSAADKTKLDASLPTSWTAVAAGGTVAVQNGVAIAVAFVTTGARCFATLPNAPVDGQVAVFKAVGATNTSGVQITPGTGQSLEDPGNPGNVLAANTSVTFFGQGQYVPYRYQASTTSWLIEQS